MQQKNSKVLLAVLDGWGINKDYPGNAITQAKTPFIDGLWEKYPHTKLDASGEAIGLPAGQMGTSEVNHFAIGAGRVMHQDLVRINEAIADGSFYKNPALIKTFSHVKKFESTLHVWGLVSDGGVHSLQTHLEATVAAAKRFGLKKVAVHVVTDGRDTAPESGVVFVKKLVENLEKIGVGQIVDIVGRYYAMDRSQNMDRTQQAFQLYTQGKGKILKNPLTAIQQSYDAQVTDEFITPISIKSTNNLVGTIGANDGVVMVNFRNDRPRQITQLLLGANISNLLMTTMTVYQPDFQVEVMFAPIKVKNSLGEVISRAGLKQLRITETEKFAHMTFFLNCKREEPFEGEDRFMFDSYSDIATHDERPEMRAPDIAQQITDTLADETYDVIFTNICNADMVGHTGNIPATIKACEAVDRALAQLVPVASERGYTVIITADHGNAEEMLTEDGQMITSHSCNQIPLIIVNDQLQSLTKEGGKLADMAPTILTLLCLDIPEEMTGKSFV